MAIPISLQEALKDSITSGSFVDTKFWLFSKRRSNPGRVGGPKALFVNGHVAKRVPHLGALLDECKSEESLRSRFPANKKPYVNNYDYEDDSDLEDDDEDVSDGGPSESPPQVATEGSGSDSPDFVTIDGSDAKSSKSSDVTSISDVDSLFSELPDTKDERKPGHVGKVVLIEDVAFVTFQALLHYLYTNEIEFAPWGSVERRKARALETVSESYGIPKPSPKSVYRLADKYGIPELKELALGQIQRELSKCNIAEEAFSRYTSWYPELRELEIRQLARTLLSHGSGRTLRSLKGKIKSYTRGQLPHAKHIISAIYELMESDEPVDEIPIPVTTSSDKQVLSGDWAGLKKALTSSLTSGTFLDSQFYAVESRSSTGLPKIRPMYFCSTVGGTNFMSKLLACSSRLKGRKAPVRLADGYDSDIDEELDQEPSMDCYPRSKCVREIPIPTYLPSDPALLLNFGAAKTWSAIFLYVYTGQIAFAAISSQGVASGGAQDGPSGHKLKPPPDRDGPGVPPPDSTTVEPSSPKSIYHLATRVGLTGLCDVAFKDIQSKLDEKNIIEELFSPFTADHKDVREMEYELFRSKLKPLVKRSLIPDIIENSSSGEHPHRTVAMGLIIERSIQERRKRTLEKGKNASPPDSPSQPEGRTETPTAPIQQAQPPSPAPVPSPPPPSQSLSSSTSVPAPAKAEASPGSSTPPDPEEKPKADPEQPPANPWANPPREHTVKLVCSCGARVSLSSRWFHGIACPSGASHIKCAGCGTERVRGVSACTNCHGKFEQ